MDTPELGDGAAGTISDGTGPLVPNITRAKIESEIPPVTDGIRVRSLFFNNLPNLLRITDRREMDNNHYLATLATSDITNAQLPGKADTGYSAKYLADTPQLFIAAVNQAMADVGIDGRRVEELNAQVKKTQKPEDYEALLRYILPAYIRLRMMGYGHADLTV